MKTENNITQQQILDAGYRLVGSKGFSSVGLSQILSTAEVPKGSFYHYFKSKEQFGEALISDFFAEYHANIEVLFSRTDLNGFERLMAYWQAWADQHSNDCNSRRCLVVKLTAEVADLSEPMRLALKKGTDQVQIYLTRCIETGIADGSICQLDATQTARMLYQMWLGASLLNKLNREPQALNQNLQITQLILKNNSLI